jgi:uncharacterized protein (TIGR03083 family)
VTTRFATYTEAASVVADLVARIDDDRWDAPGLGEWDLRALVGHTSRAMVTVLTYIERPAASEEITSAEGYYALMPSMTGEGVNQSAVAERGRQAGAALGDAPAAAFRDLVDRVVARLADADPDALIQTIAGGMRLDSYLPTRTVELVVHGFDIARAASLAVTFPTATVGDSAAVLARTGVALGHGPALLDALTGRASLPEGFTVV